MAPKVTILVPQESMGQLPLEDSLTIGRLETNKISFPKDLLISRQHAIIRKQGEHECILMDLGSSNGTYLNSKLLVSPTPLRHGDEIVVGGSLIRFEFPEQESVERSSAAMLSDLSSRTLVGIRLRTVTILVCDIRSFSRMSELLNPAHLAKLLGQWFREVAVIVERSGGVVDKYIGDAFMAYWAVDDKNPSIAPIAALRAAHEFLALAQSFVLPPEVNFSFRVGIGMSQGLVASSNLGGSSQRDSSIMGDSVNIAFRLETVTKEVGYPIVVCREVFNAAGGFVHYNPLGAIALKGKEETVEAFGVEPSQNSKTLGAQYLSHLRDTI